MLYRIPNSKNEELDTLVEGKINADTTVIFVHGFGTNKDESYRYFIDIANALIANYRVVRFDFSGYGKSQGTQEESDYVKQAEDLQCILDWVKKTYSGTIYIIAQSMGTFVTALLAPEGIEKIVLTSIPNTNTYHMIELIKKRLMTKQGGIFNENGVSIYPRSNGEIQKIGSLFWKTITQFDPVKSVKKLAEKSRVIIFKPLQDEIVGNEYFEGYKKIPNMRYVELNGDHSFKNRKDRELLIEKIISFLILGRTF